jgi:Ribonuclease G/E
MRKTRTKGYIISLSGGYDSTICAYLCAKMLVNSFEQLGGKSFQSLTGLSQVDQQELVAKNLTCVYQSTNFSTPTTYKAAEEVARQLRLRDMGGIIIVDFIDMHNQDNRKILFEKLKDEMKTDRAKHNILPPSKFGIVQITRQRVRPEMNVDVQEVCPSCNGTGKVQPSLLFVEQIESTLKYIVQEQNQKNLTICIHPYIEAYITKGTFFKPSILKKWRKLTGGKIEVRSMVSLGLMEYKFLNHLEDEIVV